MVASGDTAPSPYPDGSLPAHHQTQVVKIRRQLIAWRDAAYNASTRRFPIGTIIFDGTHDVLSAETRRLAGKSLYS